MKASSPQGRPFAQIDPSSFVADPELVRAIERHAVRVPCEADRILFQQDDPAEGAYIVYKGSVTLTMTAQDGRPLFAVQTVPGSVVGLPGAISNRPYSLSAKALAGAEISFISCADLNALMHAEPLLSLKMLELLAAEVRAARKALF